MISIFVETEYTCHMSRVDILQQEAKIPFIKRIIYVTLRGYYYSKFSKHFEIILYCIFIL